MEREVMIEHEKLTDPQYRERAIDNLGLHNGVVRRCLDFWRSGMCDRQAAIELAVIYLAEENQRQFEMLTDKIRREPVSMIVPVYKPDEDGGQG